MDFTQKEIKNERGQTEDAEAKEKRILPFEPLFATSDIGRKVRVWDYVDEKFVDGYINTTAYSLTHEPPWDRNTGNRKWEEKYEIVQTEGACISQTIIRQISEYKYGEQKTRKFERVFYIAAGSPYKIKGRNGEGNIDLTPEMLNGLLYNDENRKG